MRRPPMQKMQILSTSRCALVALSLLAVATACGDSGELGNVGRDDCVQVTSGPAATQLENDLDVTVSAFFPHFSRVELVEPGACVVVGMPAGDFNVRLQRCAEVTEDGCVPSGESTGVAVMVAEGDTLRVIASEHL